LEEYVLPSFVLSLREGLEAALIIGIVLGALRKTNRTELAPVMWAGALSAAVLSLLTALVLTSFGASLEGRAEQIFEGITMFLAAGVLTWMIFWMHRQSRHVKSDLEAGVRRATAAGRKPLFLLAFLAVLKRGRTGAFLDRRRLHSNLQRTALVPLQAWLGPPCWAGSFCSTVRLDLRRFFRLQGPADLICCRSGCPWVHEFNEAGWIRYWLSRSGISTSFSTKLYPG
jgi:high-affinity iron transporter